ncbi:MAG: hypothetical protein JWM70_2018, partial [Microbacteriaceae bacterium]|nr:hypothetical protein [Microbacteriaceae bacterium]
PAIVDESDRHRVEEVKLFAAASLRHDEPGIFEHPEMFHHAEAGHLESLLEGAEALTVLAKELVEQRASGWVGQGPEYVVHASENR